MTIPCFHLFDTALGTCALAWGSGGILAVSLPSARPDDLPERMRRRVPSAMEGPPDGVIQAAIADIRALLTGQKRDLAAIALDLTGVGPFDQAVYAVARTIMPGQTLTYGQVAARIPRDVRGDTSPGLRARTVGQSLGRNPFPLIVPCHRVLAAQGATGGFSAPGGVSTKLILLRIEGAVVPAEQLPLF